MEYQDLSTVWTLTNYDQHLNISYAHGLVSKFGLSKINVSKIVQHMEKYCQGLEKLQGLLCAK